MKNRLDTVLALFTNLDARRRTLLAVALLATAALLASVGAWSSHVSYATILDGRGYDELLDAAAALDSVGVPYRIEDGHLRVPAGQLGAARGAIVASDDLPGLKDVADLQMGLTPAAQAWAFLRAREGDLASVINGIDGIEASRVNIVPQRDALFVDDEEPARASVFVQMRPGSRLDGSQVKAIANLVSGAVEGLTSERVAIIDDNGTLLADGAGPSISGGGGALAGGLMAVSVELERRYERAVSQALLPVLGFDGGFSVTANVELDLTSTETVRKNVDPDIQALLTENLEETSSERSDPGGAAGGASGGGVPGVDANLPERPAAPAGSTNRQKSNTTTASYSYPTVDAVEHTPAGSIRRVSVAVQVDSARVAALAEAGGATAPDVKADIEKAVKAAVGFDSTRNDVVSVHFLPFTAPPVLEPSLEAASAPIVLAQSFVPYALVAFALILAFWFVVRPLMASAIRDPNGRKAQSAAADAAHAPAPPLAERLKRVVEGFERVDAADLSALVREEPPAAGKVLKQWLREA